MQLALYQPEIPQNTGTLLRLGACLGVPIDIIEPCSFAFSDKKLKRSGMDYVDQAELTRYESWTQFHKLNKQNRIILLSPLGTKCYLDLDFGDNDVLLVGRESDGVPTDVFDTCNEQIYIPMQQSFRSINVAIAAAIVLGEALRQTNNFPGYDNV